MARMGVEQRRCVDYSRGGSFEEYLESR
jgi:hypothetical protein